MPTPRGGHWYSGAALPQAHDNGLMTQSTLFIAGATGYTGRELVRLGCERGCRVVAHIRPGSSSLATWGDRFTELGAVVDTTAWEPDAMAATLTALAPTQVFALLGITRSGARREGKSTGKVPTYEKVDYGLTILLHDACAKVSPPPRFVYLSAMGLGERAPTNPYMLVRWRVERALAENALPFTVVRPSFITGSDRDDFRPGERIGATLADGALAVVGMLGGRKTRDRYRSISNTDLARALLDCAVDPSAAGATLQADEIRG
jgi:nucleoside-diphosphate-sugar epimerase